MKTKFLIPGLIGSILLAGCAGKGPKEMGGGLLGAGAGALIGSQIGGGNGQLAAVAVGTLLGAWAGSHIGAQLDDRDRMLANQAAGRAFETGRSGQAVAWQNPDSGHSGTIVPTKTYEESGTYCREFEQTVMIGLERKKAYGKACRQPDGQWQIRS